MLKLLAPESPYLRRRKNENLPRSFAGDFAEVVSEAVKKVASDVDGIIGGGSFYVDGAHCLIIVSIAAM